jgi:sulfate/thiosulfate transport system substrate-binding protein
VITPNPKTSGAARWNYLSAWTYANRKFGSDEIQIKDFISKILKNVPVFDMGARGSANTFVQREIGDVLISWENEALLIVEEIDKNKYEIVYPSITILAEPPVAVVDSIVNKKGTRKIAQAYLSYLYSDEGQDIIARHYYRPVNLKTLNKYRDQFPPIELKRIDWEFGGWRNAMKIHFVDGGTFDQLSHNK